MIKIKSELYQRRSNEIEKLFFPNIFTCSEVYEKSNKKNWKLTQLKFTQNYHFLKKYLKNRKKYGNFYHKIGKFQKKPKLLLNTLGHVDIIPKKN